jgi:hypothetical protein
MSGRTYPRQIWVLTPAFQVKEVEVVKPYVSWSDDDYGDLAAEGKCYPVSEMFPSRDAAIVEGFARLKTQQEFLTKRQAAIDKKLNNLRKAQTP